MQALGQALEITAVSKAGPDPGVVRRAQGEQTPGSRRQGVDAKVSYKGLGSPGSWESREGAPRPALVGRGGERGKCQFPVAAESHMTLEGEQEINQTKQEEIGCVCVCTCVCVAMLIFTLRKHAAAAKSLQSCLALCDPIDP